MLHTMYIIEEKKKKKLPMIFIYISSLKGGGRWDLSLNYFDPRTGLTLPLSQCHIQTYFLDKVLHNKSLFAYSYIIHKPSS